MAYYPDQRTLDIEQNINRGFSKQQELEDARIAKEIVEGSQDQGRFKSVAQKFKLGTRLVSSRQKVLKRAFGKPSKRPVFVLKTNRIAPAETSNNFFVEEISNERRNLFFR